VTFPLKGENVLLKGRNVYRWRETSWDRNTKGAKDPVHQCAWQTDKTAGNCIIVLFVRNWLCHKLERVFVSFYFCMYLLLFLIFMN